jgi:hypothetical protein
MDKIVAIYKKKKFKTNWGFIFDTNVQSYVELFMNKIHVGSNEYYLCFEPAKPVGVYTNVSVETEMDAVTYEILKVDFKIKS